ncbi:MAG: alpha/beta hydrolase [Anaerolineae bacterium]|nr:alpha/beta hydrolase [Anaerolineae bacterium]
MPTLKRDAVELYYTVAGAEDGIPLAIAPGMGAHSGDILSHLLSGMLTRAGFRVLIVDNQGAGQTISRRQNAAITMTDMADDLAAAMDDAGMADAHIAGISMGGAIATTFALNFPARARSLTSVVSLAHGDFQSRSGFIVRTMRMLRDHDLPLPLINRVGLLFLADEPAFRDPEVVDQWVNAPPDPLGQTLEGWEIQTGALQAYDVRDRLGEIRMPTLIIGSPDDLLVPPFHQQQLAEAIPGAVLKMYPGGHLFMLNAERLPAFMGEVIAFLQGAEAGRTRG